MSTIAVECRVLRHQLPRAYRQTCGRTRRVAVELQQPEAPLLVGHHVHSRQREELAAQTGLRRCAAVRPGHAAAREYFVNVADFIIRPGNQRIQPTAPRWTVRAAQFPCTPLCASGAGERRPCMYVCASAHSIVCLFCTVQLGLTANKCWTHARTLLQ